MNGPYKGALDCRTLDVGVPLPPRLGPRMGESEAERRSTSLIGINGKYLNVVWLTHGFGVMASSRSFSTSKAFAICMPPMPGSKRTRVHRFFFGTVDEVLGAVGLSISL